MLTKLTMKHFNMFEHVIDKRVHLWAVGTRSTCLGDDSTRIDYG